MAAMTGALTIYRSSIGKKTIMAVSGFILFGFVFFHMVGNLKIYLGPQEINDYARFLRDVGYPLFPNQTLLWLARIILLAAVFAHIWAAWSLTRQDWTGRPVKYTVHKRVAATYAARTMRSGALIILFFIIYHIAHMTFGATIPGYVEGSVYNNLVLGFQNPIASIFYIIAMVFLALHIYHGFWSMFQTMGVNNHALSNGLRIFAGAFALAILIGNVSIPLAVMTGLIRYA